MARPRPSSVTTDCANALTCVTCASIDRMPSEPAMDRMPTISGIEADTTPPNTTSSSSATIGRPISSARQMSSAMPESRAPATGVAPATSVSTPSIWSWSSMAR